MLRFILVLVLASVVWYGWGKYNANVRAERAAAVHQPARKGAPPSAKEADEPLTFFTCDSRSSCAQMTSCEEVKFFVKNCPAVNLGASGEAPPCLKQWCK